MVPCHQPGSVRPSAFASDSRQNWRCDFDFSSWKNAQRRDKGQDGGGAETLLGSQEGHSVSTFQYDRYVSPYTNNIAELMLRQGEIPAQAALRVGDAQAGAALARGNAWAGAAQNAGQAVSGAIQQATDPRRKLETQQLEIGAGQIAAQKRAVALNGQVNQLMQSAMTQAEDGTITFDRAKLRQGFAASQVPIPLQEQTFKSLDEVDKSLQSFNQVKVDHLADLAHATLNNPHGASPETFAFTAALAKANGLVTDKQLTPIIEAIANGGDVSQLLSGVRSLSEKYKDVSKPVVVPEGATLMSPTGQTVGSGTPKPKTIAELAADAANPDSQTHQQSAAAVALIHPTVPKSYQQENVLLDGKPATVVRDPAPGGKYYDLNNQPIENAASRVKPIPAASLTIHNQNAQAPNLPAWALDDTRPTGPDANKLDPVTRMTPNGLYQAAMNNIATGQFPPTGRGSDPGSVATRSAITSKVGAIAASAGMDEPALRAFYKSNAASLTQQQKMQDAVQGFMSTADKNADLLRETLKKLPDVGSPIFNKPLRTFEKDVAGDPNMAQFATYLRSVQNEYGRIVALPTLAGQLTDSARHEAETLADPKATVPQMLGSLEALQKEGNNRLVSVGEQIQRIQKRMQAGQSPVASASPTSAAPKTVSVAQVQAVAAKNGTTYLVEKARAESEGYIVR